MLFFNRRKLLQLWSHPAARHLLFPGSWGSKAATLAPTRDTAPKTRVVCLVLKMQTEDKLKMRRSCEQQLKSWRVSCWNFCSHLFQCFPSILWCCHEPGALTRNRELRPMAPEGQIDECTSTQTGNLHRFSIEAPVAARSVLLGCWWGLERTVSPRVTSAVQYLCFTGVD